MFESHMVEQTKHEISLHSVQCEPFKVILEAFYTDCLSCDGVSSMCQVAETMQMLQVKGDLHFKCVEYFRNVIDKDNCLEILFFAKQYYIQDIYDIARHFSLAYFIDVCHSPSFSSLSPEQLISYLGDDNICVDHEAEVKNMKCLGYYILLH